MKVFLSAIEGCRIKFFEMLKESRVEMKYNLMSFYYIRNKLKVAEWVRDNTKEILIDSGAHSFQKGKKVDWIEYTKEYAEFIKKFDRANVIGYFEMDVDNIIGYDKVLELRTVLEQVSDKIIPVWHKNRGIEDFKEMCRKYAGKIVAITGFKNEDIKDEQYLMFVKLAKDYGCKIHCLGMTRKEVLDKVPFDYVDSSSWRQNGIYGRIGNRKVSKDFSKTNYDRVAFLGYLEGMKIQKYYKEKWRKYE